MRKHLLLPLFTLLASPAPAADGMNACREHRDCVVVFDSWCLMPVALNRAQLNAWVKQDEADTATARQKRQTCELQDTSRLFYAFCNKGRCEYVPVEKPVN